jgi:hypothetical protein
MISLDAGSSTSMLYELGAWRNTDIREDLGINTQAGNE